MSSKTWVDQYRRMLRALDHVKLATEEVDAPNIDARDVLQTFCIAAHNLMYHVPGPDDVKGLFLKAEGASDWSLPLAICADVANGAKHQGLDRKSAVTGEKRGHAEITRQSVTVHVGQSWGEQPTSAGYVTSDWTFGAGDQEYAAMPIVLRAVEDWDRWLAARGLLLPDL